MCQIFGTFDIPNTKNTSHQMFYMCQIFTVCVRTIANLQQYGHKCQTEKYYFIRLFSLLSFLYLIFSLPSQNLSLSLSPSSQPVLPLLTIGREQEEGSTEEGGGGGQSLLSSITTTSATKPKSKKTQQTHHDTTIS